MITLNLGEVGLAILPEMGGGIARFSWRGRDIFRRATSPKNALDLSNFPLVPYCGRIREGKFSAAQMAVAMKPNAPMVDAHNPLHGAVKANAPD